MKKEYFELRIFICFIITLLYVNYTVMVSKNEEAAAVQLVQEKVLEGFEVRIVNDHTNERLELTETLGQALAYIEEYSMHHDDLIAFDLSTGSRVASSGGGNGVIYTGF
tara:strand:- start:2128 stop:2454 length:327 start_codon:yes stop_codon:yes gene_type:complete